MSLIFPALKILREIFASEEITFAGSFNEHGSERRLEVFDQVGFHRNAVLSEFDLSKIRTLFQEVSSNKEVNDLCGLHF